MPKIINAGGARTNTTRTVTSLSEAKVITTPELVFRDIVTEDSRIVLETLPSGKKQIALVEDVAGGESLDGLEARLAALEEYFPEQGNLRKISSVVGIDAVSPNTAGGSTTYRNGKCLPEDIGERNWGHFIYQHGVAASANAMQAAKIVHMYGDSRIGPDQPEGEWIAKDDGPLAVPGYDTDAGGRERTPYWVYQTGANPVTGKAVHLVISAGGDLNYESRTGSLFRSLVVRDTYDALIYPTLSPSSAGAGNGTGGSIKNINRRLETTSNTPDKIFCANIFPNQLWSYNECILIYASGANVDFFRFKFWCLGSTTVAAIFGVEDIKGASDLAIAGRVAVEDNGSGDGKVKITVTGRVGESAVQTLWMRVHQAI